VLARKGAEGIVLSSAEVGIAGCALAIGHPYAAISACIESETSDTSAITKAAHATSPVTSCITPRVVHSFSELTNSSWLMSVSCSTPAESKCWLA
jgi:hypothetical protein